MVKYFIHEGEKAFNGVISFLNNTSDISKYIEFFSSPSADCCPPEKILTTDSENYWASDTAGDDLYFGFSFKSHTLLLQYFTIVQYKGGGSNLLYWKLQGSNSTNSENWDDLYIADGNESYCPPGPVPTFPITIKNFGFYSTFRILKTGKDCVGLDYMRLGHIELFGSLEGPLTNPRITPKQCIIIRKYLYFIYIMQCSAK